jgi:hypothetical protein
MIKFFKKWICKIFHIKQCECPTDMDPHAELYLHTPEPDVPIHVEETAKQKKIREKHKGDK